MSQPRRPLRLRIHAEDGSLWKTEEIRRFPCSIGRSENNDIAIPFPVVSTSHAIIEETPEGLCIRDTGSTNGIFKDGSKHTETSITSGSRIYFGPVMIEVEKDEAPERTLVAAPPPEACTPSVRKAKTREKSAPPPNSSKSSKPPGAHTVIKRKEAVFPAPLPNDAPHGEASKKTDPANASMSEEGIRLDFTGAGLSRKTTKPSDSRRTSERSEARRAVEPAAPRRTADQSDSRIPAEDPGAVHLEAELELDAPAAGVPAPGAPNALTSPPRSAAARTSGERTPPERIVRRLLISLGILFVHLAFRTWERGQDLVANFLLLQFGFLTGMALGALGIAGVAWIFTRRFEYLRVLGVFVPLVLVTSVFDQVFPYVSHGFLSVRTAELLMALWSIGFKLVLVYCVFRAVSLRTEELATRMKATLSGIGMLTFVAYLVLARAGSSPRGFDMTATITYPLGSYSAESHPVDGLMAELDQSFTRVRKAQADFADKRGAPRSPETPRARTPASTAPDR